jgi:transcriptional regulator with XRE-family HTH domain
VPKALPTDHDERCRANRNVLLTRVARVLREETQRQRVKQATIAHRMGLRSSASVSRLLSGNHNVSLASIADLATALDKRVVVTLVDDISHVGVQRRRVSPTTWNLMLRNVEKQQTILYLPLDLAAIPDAYVAEFHQASVHTLTLTFVDSETAAQDWRYKIVRHNGSLWTSVPRPWLRYQSARAGDWLLVTRLTRRSVAIELVRTPRN